MRLFRVSSLCIALWLIPALSQSECFNCQSRDAVKVVQGLISMGFDCRDKTDELSRAVRCRGRIRHYPQSLNIFVSPTLSLSTEIILIYHFHGWWLAPNEHPFSGAQGDLGLFLAQSKANGILVAPESPGKNETFERQLDTPERAESFFSSVEGLLKKAQLTIGPKTPKILSAHSGAYVTLGRLTEWVTKKELQALSLLRGVVLFDSVYGYREGLSLIGDQLCEQASSHYWLLYNPADGADEKRAANERLFRELEGRCPQLQVRIQRDRTTAHMAFVQTYLGPFLSRFIED